MSERRRILACSVVCLGLLAAPAPARAANPRLGAILGDSWVREFPEYPLYDSLDIQGWGHEIPRYFWPQLMWQNDAVGHESTSSFIAEGRVASALAAHPHFVLISFGLIDFTGESSYYQTDPNTYRQNLHRMAMDARAAGAEPIFVTSAPARWAATDGVHMRRPNGLEPWADAMIAQGAQDGVPVVDLFNWLMDEYDRLGFPTAQKLYGLDQNGMPDPVHFSTYGADQAARHIVSKLPQVAPHLAAFILQTPAPALPPWAKVGLVAALGLALSVASRARAR